MSDPLLFVDTSESNVTVTGNLNITEDLYITGRLWRGATAYNPGEVIEELHAVCRSTSLRGRATIQNVTTHQSSTDSYATITGSYVHGYIPPIGTKNVVYEFTFQMSRKDSHTISNIKTLFRINNGSWIEVTKARQANSGYHRDNKYIHRWVFEVGAGSDDNTLGIMTQERPDIDIQLQTRRHNSSHDYIMHKTEYWDGGGTDQFSQPMIMLKAIA
jgi:hypothetical protein